MLAKVSKIKLTRTYVNFVLLFLFSLWRPKLLGYILKSDNAIKCVKKAAFCVHGAQEIFSRLAKKKYGR